MRCAYLLLAAGAALLAGRPGVGADDSPSTEGPKKAVRRDADGDPLPEGAVARLGTSRLRLAGATSVAFSHDGKWIAAGDWRGRVRVWGSRTGREVLRLGAPGEEAGSIRGLAFSPDGRFLAAFAGEELCAWDLSTGKSALDRSSFCPYAGPFLLIDNRRHEAPMAVGDSPGEPHFSIVGTHHNRVGFCDPKTPDSELVLGEDAGEGLVVRGLVSGKRLGRIPEARRFPVLALGPGHRTLALLFGDEVSQRVMVWDVPLGRPLWAPETELRGWVEAEFLPDGALVAVDETATVRCWEPGTGKLRWVAKELDVGGAANPVAVSGDGKRVAVLDGNTAIRVLDACTGKECFERETAGHPSRVRSVAFAPDGQTIATAGEDDAIQLWEARTWKPLRRIAVSGAVSPIVFTPDSRVLATTVAGRPRGWEVATGRELPGFPDAGAEYLVGFSQDGKRLFAADAEGVVRRYDLASGRAVGEIRPEGTLMSSVCLSPDGRFLAATVSAAPRPERPAFQMCLTLSDKVVVKQLCVWDATTGRLVSTGRPHPEYAWGRPRFTPDGRCVVVPAGANRVNVWEVASGRLRGWLVADDCERFAPSPDGRLGAFVCRDPEHGSRVSVCGSRSGEELRSIPGHDEDFVSLAFSPDGKFLVTGSADATALVWDVAGLAERDAPGHRKLSHERLQDLWADLGSPDARGAGKAIEWLLSDPDGAVRSAAEHLRPATRGEWQRVVRLVRDLDADRFAVRERAEAALKENLEAAAPALEDALASSPSPELAGRAERLMRWRPHARPAVAFLRDVRGLEVLEKLGTTEARRLLERLAAGAPGAWMTREARVVLDRLGKVTR